MTSSARSTERLRPEDVTAGMIGLGPMGQSIITCLLAASRRVVGITRSLAQHAYRDLLSTNASFAGNFSLPQLDDGVLVLPDATLAAAERAAN